MSINLWRQYREAIRAGKLSLALAVARLGVETQVAQGDLRHAGVWQRAASTALFLQGSYDEAVEEARSSAKWQPDSYERALSLIALGHVQTSAARYRAALAEFSRAATIARDYRGDVYLVGSDAGSAHLTGCAAGS